MTSEAELDSDQLFVYGTLRSGARDEPGLEMRRRLGQQAELISAATIPGTLYDLGEYPGVVGPSKSGTDSAATVVGELLSLQDATGTFAWLDPYEDFAPSNPHAGQYRRVVRLALLPDNTRKDCWVYILQGPPAGRPVIEDGDWLHHLARR